MPVDYAKRTFWRRSSRLATRDLMNRRVSSYPSDHFANLIFVATPGLDPAIIRHILNDCLHRNMLFRTDPQ